ncbi:UNVERIFIED_CONTAM: hypothetical protein FKN15_042906 [Acipenser sinensis]
MRGANAAALINQWSSSKKARQLVAALEGENMQVLLDLSTTEIEDYEALLTVLDRWFGRSEPAVGFRQQLAVRMRRPEERLGILAADVLYLAHRGSPDQPPAMHQPLPTEAFISGLTSSALRQQVRMAAPPLWSRLCPMQNGSKLSSRKTTLLALLPPEASLILAQLPLLPGRSNLKVQRAIATPGTQHGCPI